MELIERYLSEVGRKLPPKNREDILKELRSAILDKLEERVPEGQPTHADYVEVLKSMGSPKKVASSYAGERYLIGPMYFPRMMQIVRYVLIALLALPIIGLLRAITMDFSSMTAAFEYSTGLISEYFNTAVGAFGLIVLIFAWMEWQDVRIPEDEQEKKWNPEDLPGLNQPGRVGYLDMGLEIAFQFVSFAFLTYFFQRGGLPILYAGATADILPISSELLIGLLVTTILQIVLHLYVMQRGMWQLSTRIIDAVIDMVGLFYAFGAVQQVVLGIPQYIPELQQLDLPEWPIATSFGIIILIVMFNHAVQSYRMIHPKPLTPAPINTTPVKGV